MENMKFFTTYGGANLIISLCKETNFGKHQIYSMITMYQSVFLPRLIYNCESWSNLTQKDISNLQDAQLKFSRRVMEVPKSTPIAALFLELGILPIQYEIEKRQLVFLTKILDGENDDPIKMSYHEMLNYQAERNWANNVHELRGKYNLPLNDENVCNMTYAMWKKMVHDQVKYVASSSLTEMCSANKKTCLLSDDKLIKEQYLTSFKPEITHMVFRARACIYGIKKNFKKKYGSKLSCPPGRCT